MARVLILLILISLGLSGVHVTAGSPGAPSEKNGGKLANTALLVVDIQNDYFPRGKMELEGSTEASLCAKRVLLFFREKKMPVVHIQHISVQPGATFFLPGTEGAKIQTSVAPDQGETIIQKHYPNSFRDTSLWNTSRMQG